MISRPLRDDKAVSLSTTSLSIKIKYSTWLEGLFIALRNKKSVNDDNKMSVEDEKLDDDSTNSSTTNTTKSGFTTCTLEQVRHLPTQCKNLFELNI